MPIVQPSGGRSIRLRNLSNFLSFLTVEKNKRDIESEASEDRKKQRLITGIGLAVGAGLGGFTAGAAATTTAAGAVVPATAASFSAGGALTGAITGARVGQSAAQGDVVGAVTNLAAPFAAEKAGIDPLLAAFSGDALGDLIMQRQRQSAANDRNAASILAQNERQQKGFDEKRNAALIADTAEQQGLTFRAAAEHSNLDGQRMALETAVAGGETADITKLNQVLERMAKLKNNPANQKKAPPTLTELEEGGRIKYDDKRGGVMTMNRYGEPTWKKTTTPQSATSKEMVEESNLRFREAITPKSPTYDPVTPLRTLKKNIEREVAEEFGIFEAESNRTSGDNPEALRGARDRTEARDRQGAGQPQREQGSPIEQQFNQAIQGIAKLKQDATTNGLGANEFSKWPDTAVTEIKRLAIIAGTALKELYLTMKPEQQIEAKRNFLELKKILKAK